MADICAVLNLHREGLMAHASFRSILEARAQAEAEGIVVEIVAVLDRPDAVTRELAATFPAAGTRILELAVGDLGMSRNAAVEACNADFVAFLDGDDLWSPPWLARAWHAATSDPREIVWHPEANLYFGPAGGEHWFLHPDMDAPDFDRTAMALQNCWTALCLAPRQVLRRIPYQATRLAQGVGYEDWSWHAATMAAGVLHKTVPGTVHLIRRKAQSLVQQTFQSGALPIPTHLLLPPG